MFPLSFNGNGAGVDGKSGSDTLIIHHNGHGPCNGGEPARKTDCTDCTPNFDTAQDWLNQLGLFSNDVVAFSSLKLSRAKPSPWRALKTPTRVFHWCRLGRLRCNGSVYASAWLQPHPG